MRCSAIGGGLSTAQAKEELLKTCLNSRKLGGGGGMSTTQAIEELLKTCLNG
jgi:hypothetical protein